MKSLILLAALSVTPSTFAGQPANRSECPRYLSETMLTASHTKEFGILMLAKMSANGPVAFAPEQSDWIFGNSKYVLAAPHTQATIGEKDTDTVLFKTRFVKMREGESRRLHGGPAVHPELYSLYLMPFGDETIKPVALNYTGKTGRLAENNAEVQYSARVRGLVKGVIIASIRQINSKFRGVNVENPKNDLLTVRFQPD